jgi:3-keto-5-aminohexanoate cleavage enzyme
MNNKPVIITVAAVGAEVLREHTPYIPITPEEIADDVYNSYLAGASIAHLHVRDEFGMPSQDKDIFKKVTTLIKEKCDIIIQYSTGGAVGMDIPTRTQGLVNKPDMGTLSTGSINFGNEVFTNTDNQMIEIAKMLKKHGVKPEIEVFDTGMIDNAIYLLKKGYIETPLHFDFVTGIRGGVRASKEALEYMLPLLPENSTWCVAGIGRAQFEITKKAIKLGGHVRVGMEDNIFLEKGVLTPSNAKLVEKMANLIIELEPITKRRVATVEEARKILNL